MKNVVVSEIRYDLVSDLARLDMDSQMALLDLGVAWSERNAELAAEAPFELAPYEELSQWPCLIQAEKE
jgi:hypothetical protein